MKRINNIFIYLFAKAYYRESCSYICLMFLLAIIGCKENDSIPLVGTILKEKFSIKDSTFYEVVNNNKLISNLYSFKSGTSECFIKSFFNNDSTFIGKYKNCNDSTCIENGIIVINIHSIIIDTILYTKNNLIDFSISNDSIISILYSEGNSLYNYANILFYDYKSNKYIDTIKNIGIDYMVFFANNNQAWSNDGEYIIYTVSANIGSNKDEKDNNDKKIIENKTIKNRGIHLYSLKSKIDQIISQDYIGTMTKDNKIVYIDNNDVVLYDYKNKSKKIINIGSKNKNVYIYNLISSPDSKYVLAWYKDVRFNSEKKYYTKIYNLTDNKEYNVDKNSYIIDWIP